MSFLSLHFLFFLPVSCFLYFLVPRKVRWMVLLGASGVFYLSNSVSAEYFPSVYSLYHLLDRKEAGTDPEGNGCVPEGLEGRKGSSAGDKKRIQSKAGQKKRGARYSWRQGQILESCVC